MADETATVCIANIGPKQRQMRMRFGTVLWVISVALATLLIGFHTGRLWRIGLFLPLWMGAVGVFQARDRT